jgi:hypothetical protein
MTPNPKPATGVNRPSAVDRNVMCARYGDCLDFAVGHEWDGFSCCACHAFAHEHPEDPHWHFEQGERARWLLFSAGLLPSETEQYLTRKNVSGDHEE